MTTRAQDDNQAGTGESNNNGQSKQKSCCATQLQQSTISKRIFMTQQIKSVNQIAPWKLYVSAITEAILCFIVTSFCLGIYLIHQEGHWALTILMAILYLVCFGIIVSRIVSKFSLAALMLAIPITPLLILIIVVSMLPILDHFQ